VALKRRNLPIAQSVSLAEIIECEVRHTRASEAGNLRLEGKEYHVAGCDVMYFRFVT